MSTIYRNTMSTCNPLSQVDAEQFVFLVLLKSFSEAQRGKIIELFKREQD